MKDARTSSAEELFEQFLAGGEGGDPSSLLARCRPDEQARLARAFAASDRTLRLHEAPPVATPQGIGWLRARLRAAKRAEEYEAESRRSGVPLPRVRLAEAERRLGQSADLLRTDPLAAIADALNIAALFPKYSGSFGPVGAMRRSGADVKARLSFDGTWLWGQAQRVGVEAERVLALANYAAPPVDLDAVARSLALLVVERDLSETPERETEGCTITDGTVGGILVNMAVRLRQRRRFTFAHEIAHYVLHAQTGVFRDTAAELSDYATVQELEANLFASALLMPRSDLVRYAKPSARPSFDRAEKIAMAFNVSLQAALIRLVRDSDYACAFVSSKDGRVDFAINSVHLDAYVQPARAVSSGTVAAQLFRGSGRDRTPETRRVSSAAWFDRPPTGTGNLEEASMRMSADRVYSLLIAG